MTIVPIFGSERNVCVRPQKTFYSVKIPVDHPQLRQLLACPSNNLLYYTTRENVYCLNTRSGIRTLIVKLPFRPSCIAAAHGWLCAGGLGDGGHFAAIKLPESPTRGSSPRHTRARWEAMHDRSSQTDNDHSLPYRMRHERLGEYVTNSVSIQRLPAMDYGSEDEMVAVLTNNDYAVRVYSLTNKVDVVVGKYEFAMNHASISPDGGTMFIVGDKEIAYVYQRKLVAYKDSEDEIEGSSPHWCFLRKLELYKPKTAKISAYFTTAWSSTGRLCATASEHGYITVFDTERLMKPDLDPVVALVPSSRPNSTPGAIRAISFTPDPWDLLIWTECRGRMCVADLRSGLHSRQVIELDSQGERIKLVEPTDSSETLNEPELPDFGSEIEFIRRHQRPLSQPNNAAAVSFESDYLAHSAERRRLHREAGVPELHGDLHGLTEQEQQILDGLRTTRQRQILDGLRNTNRLGSGSGATRNNEGSDGSGVANNSPAIAQSSISQSTHARIRAQLDYSQAIAGDSTESRQDNAVLGSIRDYMRRSRFDDGGLQSFGGVAAQQQRHQSSAIPPSHDWPANGASRPATSAANSLSRTDNAQVTSTTLSAVHPNHEDSDDDSIPELLPREASTSTLRGSSRATLPNLRERAAYLDAERRRIQQLTANSSGNEALTTRGEAMYARVERERERERGGERESNSRAEPRGLAAYEASFFRQMNERAARVESATRISRTVASAPDGVDDSPYPPDTWGVGTSGMCWAEGGKIIYVGTEKGIFELDLDFESRKYWPAISLR